MRLDFLVELDQQDQLDVLDSLEREVYLEKLVLLDLQEGMVSRD